MPSQKVSDRGQPFGHPRTGIQQIARPRERREIDLDLLAAQPLQSAIASRYSSAASSSPKNSAARSGGTPKRNGPPTHGAASSPGADLREYGSRGSKPRAAANTVQRVVAVARENRNAIEGAAGRHHAALC